MNVLSELTMQWPEYLKASIDTNTTDIHLSWGRSNKCLIRRSRQCIRFTPEQSAHRRWCSQLHWHCGFAKYNQYEFAHQSVCIAGQQVRVCYATTLQGRHMVLRLHQSMPSAEIDDFMVPWQGGMLISGLTGSGKTTTAYRWLQYLGRTHVVVTLEDPPEMYSNCLVQMLIHPSIGTKDVLKSVLRHDPDIIFVGEIRDRQAVDLFRNWLLTGHMVISTIHASCPRSAWRRLQYLGFPKDDKYLLSGIVMIDAQTRQQTLHKSGYQ